jgi:hypothetical protein
VNINSNITVCVFNLFIIWTLFRCQSLINGLMRRCHKSHNWNIIIMCLPFTNLNWDAFLISTFCLATVRVPSVNISVFEILCTHYNDIEKMLNFTFSYQFNPLPRSVNNLGFPQLTFPVAPNLASHGRNVESGTRNFYLISLNCESSYLTTQHNIQEDGHLEPLFYFHHKIIESEMHNYSSQYCIVVKASTIRVCILITYGSSIHVLHRTK